MRCAVDVQYSDVGTRVAALLFAAWDSPGSSRELVLELPPSAPYVPGEFYRRELPPILAVLDGLAPDLLIVDGFVWLEDGKPGLGARVHEATGVAVVGVAKTAYRGAERVIEVRRGESDNPLHVSAVGIDLTEAAAGVRGMAGEFRVPTLLRRVDQLARGLVVPHSQG